MNRFIGLSILIVGFIATLAPPTGAAEPPAAHLSAGEVRQTGNVKAYCWNDAPIIQTCYGQDFYSFPKDVIDAEELTSIVFEKIEPPEKVTIRYWTRISRADIGSAWFDRPRGKARTIEAELEPLISAEGLQWQATFEPPEGKTIYVAAKAKWVVETLCPGCNQWVTWAFSLR